MEENLSIIIKITFNMRLISCQKTFFKKLVCVFKSIFVKRYSKLLFEIKTFANSCKQRIYFQSFIRKWEWKKLKIFEWNEVGRGVPEWPLIFYTVF